MWNANNVVITSIPSVLELRQLRTECKQKVGWGGIAIESKLNYKRVTKQGISSSRIFINYNSQKLFVGFRSWQQHIPNFGLVF